MDKVKIKLLIIDDEKDIRDSLKDILIDEGYEIHLAENALEAKKIKLSQTFDLILLFLPPGHLQPDEFHTPHQLKYL